MRTLSLLLITATVCSAAVTPPEQIKVPPGFKVELLREAGPREGSWICMAQDDQGRLYISPQGAIPESGFNKDSKWGGIWRVTLGKSAQSSVLSSQSGKADATNRKLSTEHWALSTPAEMKWDRVPVPVGDAMGMLWAFDSLYVSGMGPQGRGIYRCTSSKHDGNLDNATLFKAIPGGAGEHGAHAIILGPDKKLYIVNGNSTGILDGLSPDSPYRHWGEDDLLPRLKDPVATFFDKIKAPYGCVYRTDADGTKWELFAGGFRNPYDIAFNPDGELFTYDSDMEWDRGLPWYRPTRILHVVPGGEYGFREGSAKWPAYFPDSLPAVADIGVGCPTGIKFGTDAKGWPEKYRRALFLHDWTYGRILAVTLHEKGASYTAKNDLTSYTFPKDAEANGDVEVFLSGKGMPVTDLEFLRDGSMVFTVGGRGTAAALYRVSYQGKGTASRDNQAPVGDGKRVASGSAGAPPAVSGASPETPDVARLAQSDMPSTKEPTRTPDASGEAPDAAGGAPALPIRHRETDAPRESATNPAPEAQRKLTGGAASEASATTGSPSAKASAPDGAQENAIARAYRRSMEAFDGEIDFPEAPDGVRMSDLKNDHHFNFAELTALEKFGRFVLGTGLHDRNGKPKSPAQARANLTFALAFARLPKPDAQEELVEALKELPLTSLDDDLKLLKLRVLELSFARQGRPSEEWVKTAMQKLLAHYPAPPIPANAATPARNPAAGAPVDDPAWRLNRELCALLTWLSNPELGALNSELPAKPQSPANPQAEARPTQNNASAKSNDDTLPTEAPPVIAKTPNSGLGPVPNPGANIFPGRKGAAFHAELGRQVIEKTLALMDAAPSQEEQIHYAFCLRWAHGWTPEQRVRYFRWFHEKTVRYTGGNSFVKFAEAIRADAASRVPESERQPDSKLADWLRPLASPRPAVLKPRAFVKAWTLPDIEAALNAPGLKDRKPDLARGKELYTQAQCAQCHLFRDAGGNVGPDLTAVAQRFGRHDILESITDPSKVVSEQYAMVTLTILDGKGGTAQVSGLVKEETSATVTILTDPLAGKASHFYKNVIVKREKAAVSIMPPALLYTLTAEEVADLLALFGAK